ncbi:hypothetical protein TcYC6_0006420 [Trypanosoma cruzi]|nr:hypothetical protein TcYC6_0006420 [Trypanosoma cruzi]
MGNCEELSYEEAHAAQTRSGPTVLSKEHQRKNLELRSRLRDVLPIDDRQKLSDCDLLYRFLIGRRWVVEAADASLRTYVSLRKKMNLNTIIAEKFSKEVESTASCLYGFDKEGFPVMWNTPDIPLLVRMLKGGFERDLLRVQMQSMEKARFLAKERHVDRCTLVLDLRHVGISSANSVILSFARELAKIMQAYYPEIMCRMLVFNAGWAVAGAWKVLRPFVDQRVQDKVRFFPGAPTMEAILPFIDEDQFPPSFGGKGTRDVVAEMLQAEIEHVQGIPVGESPQGASNTVVSTATGPTATNASITAISLPHSVHPGSLRVMGEKISISTTPPCLPENTSVGVGSGGADAFSTCVSADNEALELFSFCSSIRSDSDDTVSLPLIQIGSIEALELSDKKRGGAECRAGKERRVQFLVPERTSMCINLTEYADDKIIGFFGNKFVGEVEHNFVYGASEGFMEGVLVPRTSSSFSSSFPTAFFSAPSAVRERVMMGELLNESGHRIHPHVIVCDAQRRARFVLRKSRLRRCVDVFQFLGGANVMTDSLTRHTVSGERVKLAKCVPHREDTDDPTVWMMNAVTADGSRQLRQRRTSQCLAEKKGQTLIAYGMLAAMAPIDVFTLLVGVCRVWEAGVHLAPRGCGIPKAKNFFGVQMPLVKPAIFRRFWRPESSMPATDANQETETQ